MGELIVSRLAKADTAPGFILDGFPRTAAQVAILDRVMSRLGIRLDGAYLLVAPENEIVRRLSGRRVCPGCAAVYHIDTHPPKSSGVCDSCGTALIQRPDDSEDVVLDRLHVYREQTLPVAEIYRSRSVLREVDGTGDPQAVLSRLRAAMGHS
jgi:adenylate kinase